MKQIYQVDNGKYTLNTNWEGYREIMYELTIPQDIVFNPFINLIKCSYTFKHNKKTILVEMSNHNGRGIVDISCDDVNIMNLVINDFYSHHKFQVNYWNMFGVPLIYHLMQNGTLTDENIDKYCSCFFYPPVGNRTDWDVIEIRPDYYIHKIGDEWCLYHWISGQKEVCMDLHKTGKVDKVIASFRKKVDKITLKADKPTSNWSAVVYNEDGTITLTKCG